MRSLTLHKDLALVAGRDGYFLVNRNDFYIGMSIEVYGEYGGIESETLKSLIKPGQTVIEVGANIGSHTVGLAKRVGSSGKVFAFEPQRACFALLQSQLALNQLHHVVAFNEGCGAADLELWVPHVDYSKQGNFGGVALEETGSSQHQKVRVRRLDDLDLEGPVHLIKVDVEGMERQVLEGAALLIERSRPVLYVENDRVANSVALISLIQKLGYRLWWDIPPLFNPDNFFRIQDNIYGPAASFNMLCVHRLASLEVDGRKEIMSSSEPHPVAA